ncbi:hypothetical protein NE645_16515 [Roseburia hominis]|nr:hypothetical protein [Roseburia hominis]
MDKSHEVNAFCMINVICALSNYAIDFPKTGKNLDIGECQKLYKDLVPPEDIREKFKPQKIKYPQFFKYVKGKKSNLAEYTDSPMDRIAQYIDKTVGSKHYKYEIGTDEEFDYRQLMNNSVGKNSKPLFEVDRTDERYLKAYNVLNSRKKAKQKLCQDIKKEIDRKNTDTKEITAKYDVFHYYCIKEIKDIFTDKNGIFNVNLAVNYIIDMEYKSDFYTTSKDILWKCFGNVIVDNLNRNQKTGITLKERPRMCYKKAVKGNDELDQMITDRMERKSIDITQADMLICLKGLVWISTRRNVLYSMRMTELQKSRMKRMQSVEQNMKKSIHHQEKRWQTQECLN